MRFTNQLNQAYKLGLYTPRRPDSKSPNFGGYLYAFMQHLRQIAPVTHETEAKQQKTVILIHYDVIIKQTN